MEKEKKMYCPKCGAKVPEDKCLNCGYILSSYMLDAPMTCPRCTTTMKESICRQCGYNVSSEHPVTVSEIKKLDINPKMILTALGGLLILFIIVAAISYNSGRSVVVDKAISQMKAKVEAEMSTINEKLENSKINLKETEATISKNKETIEQMNDYIANRNKYDSEIINKQATISTLDSDIQTKQAKLEQLNNGIIKVQASPRTLPAGEFVVGNDIEPGRYSITGSSNLVIYSLTGELKVNVILGDWGVEEYVCTLVAGDSIKARSKCVYTPIQ